MKLTKPWFYDEFECTAAGCSDNCCIGWEIDIDSAAMERFSRVEGDFGKELRSAINYSGECPTFALHEGERCALLRQDGLCSLLLHEGEDILCDICALHPRFFGWYNGLKEAGLGLCCEEVCRLLFSDSGKLRFTETECDEAWEETCSEELLQYLLTVRSALFDVLQDRTQPLPRRMLQAAQLAKAVQEGMDNGVYHIPKMSGESAEIGSLSAAAEAMMSVYSTTESLNSEWDRTMKELSENMDKICGSLPEFMKRRKNDMWKYEHVAVYFLYRHLLNGVFEGEIYSRVGLAAMAVLSLLMLDCLTWLKNGELTEWDEILNLKLYSKQMEYSEENLNLLLDSVWDNPVLSPESISAALC